MRKIIISIIMMIGLVGCLGHPTESFHYVGNGGYSPVALKEYKVLLDDEFGEADKLLIEDAILQWNYALNGHIRIVLEEVKFSMHRVAGRDEWIILKIDSNNILVTDSVSGGHYTLAWVNAIGGNYMWLIRDRLRNDSITGVVMHEIGHLLGARHDDVYLMSAYYNWSSYRCIDYEALRRVAEYQHISIGGLNYCVYGSNVKLWEAVKVYPL
jgi:hypothetical protein